MEEKLKIIEKKEQAQSNFKQSELNKSDELKKLN